MRWSAVGKVKLQKAANAKTSRTLEKVGLWLRICQSWKFLQILASYDQFGMCVNFLHGFQRFWTILVKIGQLLENCVFGPNHYFQHSYAISACFGRPGTIFWQFWTLLENFDKFWKMTFLSKLTIFDHLSSKNCVGKGLRKEVANMSVPVSFCNWVELTPTLLIFVSLSSSWTFLDSFCYFEIFEFFVKLPFCDIYEYVAI